jgi:hypothetical protein
MKTKRPTVKEIRARAAESAYCAASSILKEKWRPMAWEDMKFNKNPTTKMLWELIEKIDKLCSEQANIRHELEDKRRKCENSN